MKVAYENKGSMAPTVTVSRIPNYSGNYVCDGTADDVQIQAAIDYVDELGGGKIFIGSGIYEITSRLNFTDKRDLIFEGESIGVEKTKLIVPIATDRGTILKLADNRDTNIIFANPAVADLYNLSFRNLYLFGNGGNQTSGDALSLTNCKRTTLENIRVWDAWDYGIKLIDCEVSWIYNCEVAESGAGFNLGSARMVVVGCEVGNTHAVARGSGFGFFIVTTESEFVGLKAGLCEEQGIRVNASTHSTFLGGITETNQKDGIAITGSSDGIIILGMKVQNNDQVDGGWDGIRISASTNCIIENNHIFDDQGTKTQSYGIREEGASDYNLIRNNNVRGNDDGGIIFVGVNTVVEENLGYNPVGIIATPFDTPNGNIEINGTAAIPTANTAYTIRNTDIMISSTDSGNTNNAIIISDPAGTQINPVALSTIDVLYLPKGHQINWGAFTGAAPTIVVSFV